MSDVYMPDRPVLPGGYPFEPPPPKPAPDMCAPVPTPPPPPPCGRNPDIPVMRPVPPVPSPVEGSSLYESMAMLAGRVNECIEQWNVIQRNNYEYLRQGVEIARANDVYYDNHEVCFTEGYDTTEGCEYAIVRKKMLDHCGRPIYVKLIPAYRNSSNPGVNQPIFNASFVESANVIITATPAGAATWEGPAMWNGNPIPGTMPEDPETPVYVYGFTRRGALRYFDASTITPTTLNQQGMFNVIGGCTPIIYDGKLLDGVEEMTERKAVTAIGYNSGNGDVLFFSCSAQNQPGMGIASVARILQEYGATTAVVTSATVNTPTATASEGMLYMGQMTTDPVQAKEPANLAYWVVSKKPFFKNAFQKEVADLVQTTGQNAWKNYLLGVQIQSFDDRITDNAKNIADEINRAKKAEEQLRADLEAETDRATEAEAALQEAIDEETRRAKEAEQAETQRATQRENELEQKIADEAARAKGAETDILQQLNKETLRAIQRETEIQDALDKEIRERISADNDLINAIQQEVLARQAADTELGTRIDKVKADLSLEIFNLETKINEIISGATDLPFLKLTGGTLTGSVSMTSGNTLILGRNPTQPMEAASKQYVDSLVSGGTSPGGDVSREYVDQQVQSLQTQLDDKVSKSGDTMTGALDMDNNKIKRPVLSSADGVKMDDGADGPGRLTNLAAPVMGSDAVNLDTLNTTVDDKIQQSEEKIKQEVGTEFLPLAGGDMTGDLNMTRQSVIKFYDTRSAVMTRSLLDQEVRGSVYNDDTAMVLKSEVGPINLKGTDVSLSDGSGSPIAMSGLTALMRSRTDPRGTAIMLQDGQVLISSQTLAVGNGNTYNGAVKAGSLLLADSAGTIVGTVIPHNGHLDINVNNANGEVYVNKSGTTGGTGRLNVSRISAPDNLTLAPAGAIDVLNSQIKNVQDATDDKDAVNLAQVRRIGGGFADLTEIINSVYIQRTNIGDIETTFNVMDCLGQVVNYNVANISTRGYVENVYITLTSKYAILEFDAITPNQTLNIFAGWPEGKAPEIYGSGIRYRRSFKGSVYGGTDIKAWTSCGLTFADANLQIYIRTNRTGPHKGVLWITSENTADYTMCEAFTHGPHNI